MAEEQSDNPQSRNIFYPLIILVGIVGNILSGFSQLQAIYSSLGIFFSTLLIGVGVIGFFVNQRRIELRDGILYAIIWTMVIALAGAGYYFLITQDSTVYGIILDNTNIRNPVNNIEVSLYQYSTGTTSRVRTNDLGSFRFDSVSQGEFDVIINGISIYSDDTPTGIRKLIDADVNTGRFYIEEIGAPTSPATNTPTPPTDTATNAPIPPTNTPTNTPIPPTNTPTNTPIPPTNTPTNTPIPPTDTATNAPRPPTSTPTPIPIEHLLVSEDFNDGVISGWTDPSDQWEITYMNANAVYHSIDNTGPAEIEMGEVGWQEYAVEFDISTRDIADGGRVFIDTYRPDRNNQIIVALDFRENSLQLFEYYRGVITELGNAVSYTFEGNKWATVGITVQNQRVRVYLDNRQRLSANLSRLSPRGRVRFRSPNSSILFDNIRIWTLEGVFVPTETPTPRPPTNTPTPIPIDHLLVSEDFNDGIISAWTDPSDQWEITYMNANAVYHSIDNTGSAEIEMGEAGWQDYAVEFDISTRNIADGGRVFIDTYRPDRNNQIIVALDFRENSLQLFEYYRGVITELGNAVSYTFVGNKWATVRILVQNQRVRVYLDNRQRLSANLSRPSPRGRVRFRSPNSSILFDNILIWRLNTSE